MVVMVRCPQIFGRIVYLFRQSVEDPVCIFFLKYFFPYHPELVRSPQALTHLLKKAVLRASPLQKNLPPHSRTAFLRILHALRSIAKASCASQNEKVWM